MPGRGWSDTETAELLEHGWQAYAAAHPERTPDACRVKHNELKRRRADAVTPAAMPIDKQSGELHWREAIHALKDMQGIRRRASHSQDRARIRLGDGEPVCIVALSDTHVASWGTDHELFESVTDEILNTPNLYIGLLGDLAQMSIKLRGVAEVADNMVPPELQAAIVESWLQDIAPRVAFATWDNHAVDREEQQSGISAFARLQNRRFVYHGGIGHPDILVGDQTYRLAVSHRFLGRSIDNPAHAAMRYLRREGPNREIAMQGDYHVPGLAQFMHGGEQRLAVHTGAFQTASGYAKRWFSLNTAPVMPCVVLYPDDHRFIGYWSIADYKRAHGLD